MATIVRMPEVLAGASEAAIANWLVKVGDAIAVGDMLAEVETEKATVEYAAEVEGTVLDLLIAEGEQIAVGEPIAVVGAPGEHPADAGGGTASDAPAQSPASGAEPAEPAEAPEPETAPEPTPSPVAGAPTELPSASGTSASASGTSSSASGTTCASASGERRFASPLVRRLAKERGVDLETIDGTGPGGRIVRRDLERAPAAPGASAAASPAAPAAPAAAPISASSDDAELVPLTGMRKAIARRLTESKSTVPHFYLVAHCRVDRLLALRAEVNEGASVKTSVNDYVLKAVAAAYADVPEANVTWADTALEVHRRLDLAVAVAIDGGLVTPVVRDIGTKSVTAIHAEVADFAERARSGGLKQHELEGGTAAVSNLGMYGTSEFSAIINPPQSMILAVGAAQQRPIVVDGELAVGSVMTVTMSCDHRAIDGALGARWLAAFTARIEQPLSMLV